VRKARYDFDAAQVAPYFELNHVVQDGVFYAAHELYGLTFKERKDLPVYRPEVRVFEVFDSNGKGLALFIADYFARDSKQGGAWMNAYVEQSRLLGLKAVVSNQSQHPQARSGQPVLLSFDEVTTLFPRVRSRAARHALERGVTRRCPVPRRLRTLSSTPRSSTRCGRASPKWLPITRITTRAARPMPQALLAKVLAGAAVR